jgi:hypothetical protein
MANPLLTHAAAGVARRVPYLRKLPILRLLLLGELVLLAKEHYDKLTPRERRRLVALLRQGNLRPSNLSSRQREELATIVAKAEPRVFVGAAAQRLSPVPLPVDRLVGRRAGPA